jgi:hypothetical protein
MKYISTIAAGILVGALALVGAVYALDYCKAYRAEAPAPVLLKGRAMAWSWAPDLATPGPYGELDGYRWEVTPHG